jgi:hypothetical protein
MELTIGPYRFRLEILLLIVVVSWVMFGHLLSGCCRVSLFEAFTAAVEGKQIVTPDIQTHMPTSMPPTPMPESSHPVKPITEGFTSTVMAPEFSQAQSPGYIMDPSNWNSPTMTYSPGATPSAGAESVLHRTSAPLANGELDIFAGTEFKPECCPNTYSSSEGCACMTMDQYNSLRTRAGNNVPYSEY